VLNEFFMTKIRTYRMKGFLSPDKKQHNLLLRAAHRKKRAAFRKAALMKLIEGVLLNFKLLHNLLFAGNYTDEVYTGLNIE
jgi:hypothetical protein